MILTRRAPGPPLSPIPAPRALLWSDEFEGTAGTPPSSANWSYNIGRYGAGDGENQYYTNSTANAQLDGASNLVLSARQETPPDAAGAPNNFTSARLVTKSKQTFGPGTGPIRITMRAKVPAATGILAQFWTIGQPDDWPHAGEIDFLELPSHLGKGTFVMNLHGPTQGSPTVDKSVSFGNAVRSPDALSADYHVVGADWWPDRIVTHFDGRYTGQVTQAQYTAAGGDWSPFSGSWNHYLIMNIAVGNDWTGDPDGTTPWPVSMTVDWLRVWSLT